MFTRLMDQLKVNRAGPGLPGNRRDRVRGEKSYSSRAIRTHLRDRGIVAVIPQPSENRSVTGNDADPPAAALRPSTKRTTKAATPPTQLPSLQAVAGLGDPLRQTCSHLSRRSSPPGHRHLGDSFRKHALVPAAARCALKR